MDTDRAQAPTVYRSEASPGGAEAIAFWMASTSANADPSVSSTAASTDGPSSGLMKSMFTVCAYCA